MTSANTQPILPEPKVLTVLEAVNILKGLSQNRHTANLLYKQSEKSVVAEQVAMKLFDIAKMTEPSKVAYACIRLERELTFIAPRTSLKIFNTYMDKVDNVLAGMREMIVFLKSKQIVN